MTTIDADHASASDASADALGAPTDVERLHRDLPRRRDVEPFEGEEPAPIVVWVLAAGAIFLGGWLLGRHWGVFGTGAHLGYVLPGGAAVAPELEAGAPMTGEELYRTRCAACHQQNAEGVPGSFPPLVGSEWVTGDPATIIRILLGGLAGPIEVKGARFNGNMPAWGSMMSDEQIASVATYVRGLSNAGPVDAAAVAQIRGAASRSEPWTAEALRAAERASASTPDGGGTR